MRARRKCSAARCRSGLGFGYSIQDFKQAKETLDAALCMLGKIASALSGNLALTQFMQLDGRTH
ncbi:hypothetical protein BSZ19_42925 [Bradyrhizobium japonicum]|uniref:Uncharacterized protein n=1 Tax=Bradyrhizobium japonicum TaxID=375 RepID=A0A1Y2JD49_BRAJP|nr:hypothetical protein BSZ19_42925 [Bradyrhizobium japonicum]